MLHRCDEHVRKRRRKRRRIRNDSDNEERRDELKVNDTFQAFAVFRT